jgi:hypothetical protein
MKGYTEMLAGRCPLNERIDRLDCRPVTYAHRLSRSRREVGFVEAEQVLG